MTRRPSIPVSTDQLDEDATITASDIADAQRTWSQVLANHPQKRLLDAIRKPSPDATP